MRRRHDGGSFRPIEEVAAAAGALLPRRDRGRHLAAMAAWRAAVGERMHRSTRVAEIGPDCFTVEVPDTAWGDTLRKLEGQILQRVRRTLGPAAPQRIEFRISPGVWRPATLPRRSAALRPPDPLQRPPEAPAAPTPPATAEAAPGMREEDLRVRDPALRRALLRVANRYLRRAAQSSTPPRRR